MSYDDPNQYAHTDRNEYDRDLDARDRAEAKGPAFTKKPGKAIFLGGPDTLGFTPHPYRGHDTDNDPEE